MDINELKQLSKTDRIQAMETLWDSLLYEDGDIETPEWHEQILAQRKKAIADGRAKFISLSELKASHGL